MRITTLASTLLGTWLAATASAQVNPELGDVGDTSSETTSDDDSSSAADSGTELGADGLNVDSKIRIGLELVVFDFASETFDPDSMAPERSGSSVNFGVLPSQLGLNLGYGLSSNMVLGTNFAFGVGSVSDDDDSESTFLFALLPYFEYIFTPATDMQWYVLGRLGVRTNSQGDASRTDFKIGVGGGLHWFLIEQVSFDPLIEFDLTPGSRDLPGSAGDGDIFGVGFALHAGLSLWL